jgi:hypothetical protein
METLGIRRLRSTPQRLQTVGLARGLCTKNKGGGYNEDGMDHLVGWSDRGRPDA